MNLKEAFKELRHRHGQTFRDIGAKCEINETTPWKIENDRSVRWETMHLILTSALKTQPGSADYENIHRLWLLQRQQKADAAPPGKNRKTLPKHAAAAVRDFRALLKGRNQADVARILAAAQRAAKR